MLLANSHLRYRYFLSRTEHSRLTNVPLPSTVAFVGRRPTTSVQDRRRTS